MKLLDARPGPLAATKRREPLAKKIEPQIYRGCNLAVNARLGPRRTHGRTSRRGLAARFISEAANGADSASREVVKKGERQAESRPFDEFHAFLNFCSGALSTNQLSDSSGYRGAADSKLEGGPFAMGEVVRPKARHDESKADLLALPRKSEKLDTEALQQENAQLRKLAVELSKLVVKVVVDHH